MKIPGIYSYTHLKQNVIPIRVLTLHAGNFPSLIQISLAEVRLQDDHSYEALSYTRATENGGCQRPSHIRYAGARIRLTKNCELALLYFAKKMRKNYYGSAIYLYVNRYQRK